jgi:hypothetical protein
VELEWPSSLRLGDSDIIRLALIPSQDGYTVQAEFPEHRTDLEAVQVRRASGYDVYAVARLDAVGFEISPQKEIEQYLYPGEPVQWQWSLQARQSGQQRISIVLWLRWEPVLAQSSRREAVIYRRGLDVEVRSFLGFSRGQALAGGILGLLLGGSLGAVGLAAFWRPKRSDETPSPNQRLALEHASQLVLAPAEIDLLRALFNRYARLVIEQEFLSGYSGARTFLARPIRSDGRADAHTIVKVGERRAIQREFQNYERFVKDTLPPITARIQQPPVAPRSGHLAGMQYTFIGAPGHSPLSLRQALLHKPEAALLHKLFETFGPNWWMQRRPYTFRLGLEYDRVLPTHVVIEPAAGHGGLLDGRTPPDALNLKPGDLVSLRGFPVVERRMDGRSLSLQGSAQPGQPPLRVRWMGLADPEGATGHVAATRMSLLRDSVVGLDLMGLPDPIAHLPDMLSQTLDGSQSTIHGDLNLENILVGPGGFVWLIDFAQTRDGHTLFDFAHLSAELIAHVIAPQVSGVQEYFDLLMRNPFKPDGPPVTPLGGLLTTLVLIAGKCLRNPSSPDEFERVLCLSCLGSLKYQNLDYYQKQLLYLTAAYLCADIQSSAA